MKIKFGMILTVFLALFSSTVHAEAFVSVAKTFVNGKWYEYRISEENLAKVPPWNPLEEAAPLPPHKAIAISRGYLNKHNDDIDHFALGTVTMERVVSKKVKNRWKYMISILNRNDIASSFNVIVMMDGTVVEPVEISDPGMVCPQEE